MKILQICTHKVGIRLKLCKTSYKSVPIKSEWVWNDIKAIYICICIKEDCSWNYLPTLASHKDGRAIFILRGSQGTCLTQKITKERLNMGSTERIGPTVNHSGFCTVDTCTQSSLVLYFYGFSYYVLPLSRWSVFCILHYYCTCMQTKHQIYVLRYIVFYIWKLYRKEVLWINLLTKIKEAGKHWTVTEAHLVSSASSSTHHPGIPSVL